MASSPISVQQLFHPPIILPSYSKENLLRRINILENQVAEFVNNLSSVQKEYSAVEEQMKALENDLVMERRNYHNIKMELLRRDRIIKVLTAVIGIIIGIAINLLYSKNFN